MSAISVSLARPAQHLVPSRQPDAAHPDMAAQQTRTTTGNRGTPGDTPATDAAEKSAPPTPAELNRQALFDQRLAGPPPAFQANLLDQTQDLETLIRDVASARLAKTDQ